MYGEIEEEPLGFDKQIGKERVSPFFVSKKEEGPNASLVDPIKIIDGHQLVCKLATDNKKQKPNMVPASGMIPGMPNSGAMGMPVEGIPAPNYGGYTRFDKSVKSSGGCKNCRKRTLVPDDVTGNMVCTLCGVVQDFDNFQAHIGGITGEAGTYVCVGTAGMGSFHNFKELKIFGAQKLIIDFAFKLRLSGSKSNELKLLVEKITNGEYGQGKWFPVFVGACAYVVMRKDNKMLSIVEVADLVGCDVYELGRMMGRVVDYIDFKLPEFDVVNSFERTIRSCPSFSKVSEDMIHRMLQQGVFLVQCLIKWFITTGRRPIPVVAAVLVFVGELNEVPVKIEDVAKELHVAVSTSKRRYKELLQALVKVAQILPWGKDVTLKNILKNAPFVIQYLEMKSMMKCKGELKSFEVGPFAMEALVEACLHKEIGYGFDCSATDDRSSQYFDADHSLTFSNNFLDKFQISPECLATIYSNFVDEVSLAKVNAVSGMESKKNDKEVLTFKYVQIGGKANPS